MAVAAYRTIWLQSIVSTPNGRWTFDSILGSRRAARSARDTSRARVHGGPRPAARAPLIATTGPEGGFASTARLFRPMPTRRLNLRTGKGSKEPVESL